MVANMLPSRRTPDPDRSRVTSAERRPGAHTLIRVCKAKTSDRQNVSQVTARKMMRETMTEKKVNEATWALVKSFQETNQTVVQSIIAAQERTTKFAQRFFNEGMELLKASQAVAGDIVAA